MCLNTKILFEDPIAKETGYLANKIKRRKSHLKANKIKKKKKQVVRLSAFID